MTIVQVMVLVIWTNQRTRQRPESMNDTLVMKNRNDEHFEASVISTVYD